MGTCASVYKKDLKIIRRRTKADRAIVQPESPIKVTEPVAVDFTVNTIDDSVSKRDEIYYDSNVWLDSDCEDDFFSVNGDFTPSRGNTPIHHRFSTPKPLLIEAVNVATPAETSPQKKSLSELFEDSADEDLDQEQDSKISETLPPLLPTTGNSVIKKQTSHKSCKCCFPNLISLHSLNERKKTTPN